jgi:hypothetical protein
MNLMNELLVGNGLIDEQQKFDALVKAYMEAFNATGDFEWGEDWNIDETKFFLQECLIQKNCKNIVNIFFDNQDKKIQVAAFGIGHVGRLEDVIVANQLPKDLSLKQKDKICLQIKDRLLGTINTQALYIQDLAILKKYRSGSQRILDLISPIVTAALKQQALNTFFWTSKKSRLYFLIGILNPNEIFRFEDAQDNILLKVSTDSMLSMILKGEREINELLRKNTWKSQ